ncbi:hypothetical protein G6F22_019178 [Rhizopus arrhizus]|nr:hypothetical protein G6F22_019178 [Rhizopus arrhizus]
MNHVWSETGTLQAMLDVEAALARSCAEHGVIPQDAVAPIVAACRAELFDIDALKNEAAAGGNLAIPLVRQLTAKVKRADIRAAGFVHWGATSQDIIDTGLVLQLRSSLVILERQINPLASSLAARASEHRTTPTVGRTWLQQALPMTMTSRGIKRTWRGCSSGEPLALWPAWVIRHRLSPGPSRVILD